jgi:hypothetical protein
MAKKNFLVVHRFDNIVYFKPLKREEYLTLSAFVAGATIEQACDYVYKRVRQKDRAELPEKLKKSFSEWSRIHLFFLANESDATEL